MRLSEAIEAADRIRPNVVDIQDKRRCLLELETEIAELMGEPDPEWDYDADDPELLILDEPANHLDLPFQQELFSMIGEWLEEPGRAVITVMHDLSLARKYGSHALLLNKGQCAGQGKASEVLTPEALKSVYDMDVYGWMRTLLETWKE